MTRPHLHHTPPAHPEDKKSSHQPAAMNLGRPSIASSDATDPLTARHPTKARAIEIEQDEIFDRKGTTLDLTTPTVQPATGKGGTQPNESPRVTVCDDRHAH